MPSASSQTEKRVPGSRAAHLYRRSLGPVIGAFLSGLREQKVLGSRTKDGRVLVPPLEYDPDSGQAVEPELVELASTGVVEGFTWVSEPMVATTSGVAST